MARLPFHYEDGEEIPQPVVEREPRKCKRHKWGIPYNDQGASPSCRVCGKPYDFERSRRGKTARRRGNDYERSLAKRLGISRVGQYGGPEDVAGDWIAVQAKVGGYYPERIDQWLRAIPARADRLRAVVIGDSPGAGHQRRELIVLDLDDFVAWYGNGRLT